MKRLINSKIFQFCKVGFIRIVCLCSGHKWRYFGLKYAFERSGEENIYKEYICTRCGRTKEEVI